MNKKFIQFSETKIKKTIDPSDEVINGIEILENTLFDLGVFDEIEETMLLSSYHLTYKKNGSEIFLIRPFKSDWNIKIFGISYNVQYFAKLPVTLDFELEKTGWRILGLLDVNEEELKNVLQEVFTIDRNHQFIVNPLTVIYAFYIKNLALFQVFDQKTLDDVVKYFWSGEIEKIKDLHDKLNTGETENRMKDFLTKWHQKLNITMNLKEEQIHDHMKLSKENFLSILSLLHLYMRNVISNYRNSLTALWFDFELIKNSESFHFQAEEIREYILLEESFLADMKQIEAHINDFNNQNRNKKIGQEYPELTPLNAVIKKQEETVIQNLNKFGSMKTESTYAPSIGRINQVKPDKVTVEKGKDWFEFIVSSGNSLKDIPFRTKKDLFGDDSTIALGINEYRADLLAKKISNEKRMVPEIKNLIKIIIEQSNSMGYVTKENLKKLFMEQYNSEQAIIDYSSRYSTKKSLVHQAIATKFHVLLGVLSKNGLVKEYFRDNTYQIFWNFAVYLHS